MTTVLLAGPVSDTTPKQTGTVQVDLRSTSRYVLVSSTDVSGTLIVETLIGSEWWQYASRETLAGEASAFVTRIGGDHRFRWFPNGSAGNYQIAFGENGIQA